VTVRVAGPGDAEVVARLLGDFRDHEQRHWPPDETMLAGVRRLLERDDGEFLLGGDPPAGVVQLRYRYGLWWDAEDCCVEDVFVRAEARGTGLGRALVSAAIERARERGCRRLELDTGDDNVAAQGLYRSLGFREAGLFMRRRIPENIPDGWG
jgi:ribosomal protein S18 acetylase RimI-like enzyme